MQREAPDSVVGDVETRFARDLHRQSFAAVFGPGLLLQSGDLTAYPATLPRDGLVHQVRVRRQGADGTTSIEDVNAVARVLRDGRILVVGRSVEDLGQTAVCRDAGARFGIAAGADPGALHWHLRQRAPR